MSKTRDRLTRERERLGRVWESMAFEQEEMRKQTDLLNGLTKQLEGLRNEFGRLELINVEAGHKTDSGSKRSDKFATDNSMLREGVLVQTCKVESQIKESLDAMEKLLEREMKRLHKEIERVKMEMFWNLADGLRRRNEDLDPVEGLWADEESKLKKDAEKVHSLRKMCWQRMHADAIKLEGLRMEERIRQEREERRHRQQRHNTFSHSYSHQERRERSYHSSTRSQDGSEQKYPRRNRTYDDFYGSKYTPSSQDFKSSYARTDERPKLSTSDARIISAWRRYQLSWTTTMAGESTFLTCSSIPWPVVSEPFTPSSLTPARISEFLLSATHSTLKSPMDRLRDAMKLWHPDKWEGKYMSRLVDSDKEIVREGLGMVARGLIELMHAQKRLGQQ